MNPVFGDMKRALHASYPQIRTSATVIHDDHFFFAILRATVFEITNTVADYITPQGV